MEEIKYLVDGVWTKIEPENLSTVEAMEFTKHLTQDEFRKYINNDSDNLNKSAMKDFHMLIENINKNII